MGNSNIIPGARSVPADPPSNVWILLNQRSTQKNCFQLLSDCKLLNPPESCHNTTSPRGTFKARAPCRHQQAYIRSHLAWPLQTQQVGEEKTKLPGRAAWGSELLLSSDWHSHSHTLSQSDKGFQSHNSTPRSPVRVSESGEGGLWLPWRCICCLG